MRFISGPLVKVNQDGKTFEGELECLPNGEKVLWIDFKTLPIKRFAVITPLEKIERMKCDAKKIKDPQTPFECWQFERHGNFFKEDENAETHDEISQWYWY